MINKINFTGKIFITPYAKQKVKKREVEQIQNYANNYDVDVFIYDRTEYANENGAYSAIISKKGHIWQKTFDLEHNSKSYLREIPGQEVAKGDIEGFLEGKYDLNLTDESSITKY